LLTELVDGARSGLEIVGLDAGRGVRDVEACFLDGFSTSGSAGTGLGAIRRLADAFDIYSALDRGTAIVAQLWRHGHVNERHREPGVAVGVAAAPCGGEDVSGDGWAIERRGRRTMLLVVDGLGHGQMAAEASLEAIRLFRANAKSSPAVVMHALHAGLRSTRGAAVAVTEIDAERGVVRFSGIGNISAVILGPGERRHLVSHNGTVGHSVRKVDEFAYPWPKDAVLIEHTDGLATQWEVERYPGLLARSPSLIAGVLYRDYARKRDDVTVLAARELAA
jgi:hypothetical protein